MQRMDLKNANTRRARIWQRAAVAILVSLISVLLWQAYGPWLLSPHPHVSVD